jgi:HlyD family secretion protein
MRRLVVGLIIAAVVIAGGYFTYTSFFAEQEEATTTVDVNSIALDTGVDVVSAEGRITPLDSTSLAFLLGGEVAEVLVSEGDTVAAGDPLIRLIDTDQQLTLQQAEAGLVQAQANLQTAEAGLAQAEAGLETSKLGVTAAEVQLALLTADLTEEQLAAQESQVNVAEASITQASGSRAAALEGPTAGQITAAEAQVQAAQAALLAPRNRLDQLQRDGANDDQIRQAQLAYNAAVANVQAAQANLDDLRAGATAAQQQAANAGVSAAIARRDAAQANFNLSLAGPQAEQIRVVELGVEQANLQIASAELAVQQAQVQVQNAQNGIAEAEAAVESAQALLSKMTLTAPFAGTIASVDAKAGEIIVPGVPVIILADFSRWQVETTDLTELNIVSVKRGLPVEITIDAFPGETLAGTITDIASVSDLVLGDVTYMVTIDLDDTNGLPLRWGMTSFINVDVDQ